MGDRYYTIPGSKPVPSVTTLLRRYGFVPYYRSNSAADRGSAVHYACRLAYHGSLDTTNTTQELLGYVDSFIEFVTTHKYKAQHWELTLVSDTLGVGGTIDTYGSIPVGQSERPCIVELKTGHKALYHHLQVALYAILAETHNLFDAANDPKYIVYLGGKPEIVNVTADDVDAARAILRLWQWERSFLS